MRPRLTCAALLFLFWLPAVNVPFWQDDYEFLLAARNALTESDGASKFSTLAPDSDQQLWRPIGVGAWWLFVEGALGANARAAHFASIVLLVLSALAVGWLATTVAEFAVSASPGLRTPDIVGAIAALLYGIHSSHFLPVAWVSAAADSIAVLFGALSLRYWIVGYARGQIGALAGSVFFLVLALLSRENAVVLPLLGLLLSIWVTSPNGRARRLSILFGTLAFAVTIGWAVLRTIYTAAPAPAYAFELGANVLRNAASLAFFAANGPRESLRFLLQQPSPLIAAWATATVIAQVPAVALLLRSRPGSRTLAILAAFFAIACLPYLFVSRNSYEYYVTFGLRSYAMLIALALPRLRSPVPIVLLSLLSSALAVAGSYRLEYPALIARAKWGERQLQLMQEFRARDPRIATGRVYVRVENVARFQAFGAAGIAYRLGIDRRRIAGLSPNDPLPSGGPIIVVPPSGDVYVLH